MAENKDDSQSKKLFEKIKDAPMVPMGIAGALGMLTWGAYSFRYRGKMSPSVFIMHLRIKSQSMIVGAMTFGITYGLLKQFIFTPQPESHKESHTEHVSEDQHRHIDKVMRK